VETEPKRKKSGQYFTRREFLELAGKSALAAGAFTMLDGILTPVEAKAIQALADSARLQAELLYPSTFFPALAKSGDPITAQVRMPANARVKNAALLPDGGTAPIRLKTEPAVNQTGGQSEFVMRPESAPAPGLYAIEVAFEGDGTSWTVNRPRAVWIKEDFGDTFTFAQLTDYHVGDLRGKKIAPKMDFTKLRKRVIDAVAQVKPEFVLLTGDLVYSPGQYKDQYEVFCKEILSGVGAPIFVVPGNHDLMNITVGTIWNVKGHDYWFKHIGPLYHSFIYGRYHFIGLNTYDRSGDARDVSKILSLADRKAMWAAAQGGIGFQQFDWIQSELQAANKNNRIITVFGHHTPLDDIDGVDSVTQEKMIPPEKFVKTLQDGGVHNYFYGHKHNNQYDERDALDFTCTGTSGSDLNSDDGWGFRIVDVKGDRFDSRYVEVEPHQKRGRIPAGTSAK
jgi:predicted phosphodiesterase